MPVNFNALRQTGPSGFAEGLAQSQEEQRVNALAQQKMGQDQEMSALRMQQLRGTIGEQEATRKKQSLLDKTGMFRERLLRAPTPEAAREIVKMQYADPDIGPVISQGGSLEQSLAEVSDDPKLFDRYKQQEAMGMSEWMKSQMPKTVGNAIYLPGENRFMQPPATPEKPPAPTELVKNYEYAKGQGFTGSLFDYERKLNESRRAPSVGGGAGAGAGASKALTGAQPLKPLTQLQEIKLRTDVARDYKSAATTLSQMDDLLESINQVKTAPGLSAATGYLGKLPSFPEGAAAQAETRLANLRGKVTALGKATAAMSGSIGSIANQEWKILSDQIAALDEVKGKGPLLEQIDLVEQQAKGAIARIRDQYDKTRSDDFERFPQFRDLPASKSEPKPAGATGGWGKAEAE